MRDGGRCIFLGCSSPLLELHHVRKVAQGGPNDESNLACLCPTHHNVIHKDAWRTALVREQIAVNMVREEVRRKTTKYPVRVTLPEEPDLSGAFKLYQREIPLREERDDPRDIRRWLRECEELRQGTKELLKNREIINKARIRRSVWQDNRFGRELDAVLAHFKRLRQVSRDPQRFERYVLENYQEIEDYLWVDKYEHEVVGFLYYHYYYRHRYAFLSYVIAKNTMRSRKLLENCLIRVLQDRHPECRAVIGEFDHPSFISPGRGRRRAYSRIRLFCRKYGARIISGANYLQPNLRPNDSSEEIPLVLCYYSTRLECKMRKVLPRREYKQILDFIFNSIYGSAFDTQEADSEYKMYLEHLKVRILRGAAPRLELTDSVRQFNI